MTRPVDLLTLRLFVAVCEEGSLGRAAAREALVASAVSKRIAAVEQAVGAALLVRGRRGVAPTAAGQALLRQARESTAPLAGAAGLAVVPLSDPWARRRFVVCSRDEALLSATGRMLREHLARAAGPDRSPPKV
jgi:DNA-binding transcriptional LysR family regulator